MGARGLRAPGSGRFRGALSFGASRLRRAEYLAAYHDFRRAAALAGDAGERELARGLAHLAAAGYKRRCGDERGWARQLVHARRRLAPFPGPAVRLDLAALLAAVERNERR